MQGLQIARCHVEYPALLVVYKVGCLAHHPSADESSTDEALRLRDKFSEILASAGALEGHKTAVLLRLRVP